MFKSVNMKWYSQNHKSLKIFDLFHWMKTVFTWNFGREKKKPCWCIASNIVCPDRNRNANVGGDMDFDRRDWLSAPQTYSLNLAQFFIRKITESLKCRCSIRKRRKLLGSLGQYWFKGTEKQFSLMLPSQNGSMEQAYEMTKLQLFEQGSHEKACVTFQRTHFCSSFAINLLGSHAWKSQTCICMIAYFNISIFFYWKVSKDRLPFEHLNRALRAGNSGI